METRKCEMCSTELINKRNGAKFCSDTCRAKFWDDRKNEPELKSNIKGEQVPPAKKLTDQLRGILSEPQSNDVEANDNFILHADIVETEQYKFLKTKEIEYEKERINLLHEIIVCKVEINCIDNDHTNFKEIVVPGKGMKTRLADLLPLEIKSSEQRQDEKAERINVLNEKINVSNVYLAEVNQKISLLNVKLSLIPRYEIKKEFGFLPKAESLKAGLTQSKNENLPGSILKVPPQPQKKQDAKQNNPINPSSRIISSKDLENLEYMALNFQDKWFDFFGQPSINFHCVIHGKPGEGKSTLAIQFANYLALQFGKTIYISSEEGFSKTLKDKFITNNALSDDLFVADLHSFEDIIAEVSPDTFNFIFFDSLNNMCIDADKMKQLRAKYPDSALITICQSTKDGKMRGSQEIVHDADIKVVVENGVATTTKNRFKPKYMKLKVFDDDSNDGKPGIVRNVV